MIQKLSLFTSIVSDLLWPCITIMPQIILIEHNLYWAQNMKVIYSICSWRLMFALFLRLSLSLILSLFFIYMMTHQGTASPEGFCWNDISNAWSPRSVTGAPAANILAPDLGIVSTLQCNFVSSHQMKDKRYGLYEKFTMQQ